jgi:hypothetical protein
VIRRRLTATIAAAIIVILAALAAAALNSDPAKAAPSHQPRTWIEPVRPYQPGDLVWTTSPPLAEIVPTALLSSGCQRVPATGYIGTGVYASSSSQYSNYWSWGAASSGQPFNWYVKRGDESNADSGYSGGGGGSSSLAANVYHWKVQNQGGTPQAWNVCWDVL